MSESNRGPDTKASDDCFDLSGHIRVASERGKRTCSQLVVGDLDLPLLPASGATWMTDFSSGGIDRYSGCKTAIFAVKEM